MADKILLIVIIFMFFSALLKFLLNIFHLDPYSGFSRYIEVFFGFIAAFIPVVLGLVIKDKTIKIVSIVLGSLYAIHVLISTFQMVRYMFM